MSESNNRCKGLEVSGEDTGLLPYGKQFPRISIVTPSFNQGYFIEETIRSVLLQNYQDLEYVIIDGGSTDGGVDVIRRYDDQLAFWISEPDGGQYDAINKGFGWTTGEIMAWLNSDDKYLPWTFSIVAEIFSIFPQVEWLTTAYPLVWDQLGRAMVCNYCAGFSRRGFLCGANLPGGEWYAREFIQQESTFWRRSLWDRAGGYMDSSLKLAGDFELWARFFRYAELYAVCTPLGGFRVHENQITAKHMELYLAEAEFLLRRYGGRPYGKCETSIRRFLDSCIGHRTLNPEHAPALIKAIINKLHLLYSAKRCVWSRDGWQINEAFIV